jgi:hypothetical protein
VSPWLAVVWLVLGTVTIAAVALTAPGWVVALVAWTGGICTAAVWRGYLARGEAS